MATLTNRLSTDPFSHFHPEQRVRIIVDPKMNSLTPTPGTPMRLTQTNEVVTTEIEQTKHVWYDPNALPPQSPSKQSSALSTQNWYTFPGNLNTSQDLRNSHGPEEFKSWPGDESPNLNKSFTKEPKPMETSATYKKEGVKLNGSGFIDEKDLAGVFGTPVYHSSSIKEVVNPPVQYVPSIGQVSTGIYDGTANLKTLELNSTPSLMDQVIAGATTPRKVETHQTSAEKSAEKKKISLGERMAQVGIFSNDKGSLPVNKTRSPPAISKAEPNLPRSVSPFRYGAAGQANGTPGDPNAGMTYEIRNFFESLEKVPAPKGFSIERWEREPSVRPPRDTTHFEVMQSENRDPNLLVNELYKQTLEVQKINSNQSHHSITAAPLQQIANLSSISNKDLQGPEEYMRGSQTIFGNKEKSRNSSFIQEDKAFGEPQNLSMRGSVTSQQGTGSAIKERVPFAEIGNHNEALNMSHSKENQFGGLQAQYLESQPISIQLQSRTSSVFDFGKPYEIDLPEDNTNLKSIVLDGIKTVPVQPNMPSMPSVSEMDSLRKRNEFLEGEISKYQADMLRKSTLEEDLFKQNGFLKGEIERYKQELQKKNENEEAHLKENAFLRNKIVSFESKLEGINSSINQLANENRRLNEDLMAKIRELEIYKKETVTPFDVPQVENIGGDFRFSERVDAPYTENFGGDFRFSEKVNAPYIENIEVHHVENVGGPGPYIENYGEPGPYIENYGGEFPRFSEKVRPTSPMQDYHSRSNMSMDMAYLGGFAPENMFNNNDANTPRRRIFEKVTYEKPRMVLTVDDFATV